MAVTIARVKRSVRGNEVCRYVDITGPASYTNPGGETLSASDIKVLTSNSHTLSDVVDFHAAGGTAGYIIQLDVTNSKIKYYNGTTEISNATDLHLVVIRVAITFAVVNG